ncbi:MAG: protein kinase [Candidatus Dormibacteria bacterium]
MLSVGRFQVLAEIGRGASGTVYLGRQPDLDRAVAIKQLAPHLAKDQRFLTRFRAEAQVMARLEHTNCVQVYDFVESNDGVFLICEFVDGASLRAVVDGSGRLAPEQSLGVLKGALSGLAYAHGLGLVHRDVKPDNLLADRAGTSKLADFGLAVFDPGHGDREVLGTPGFMSPEQARGGVVDSRSDVYACGVVLYELLVGRPPFRAASPLALMEIHIHRAAPDPRKANRQLPEGLARMTQRAMAKDPAARQQGAEEFLAELEAAATQAYGEDWERRAGIAVLVGAAAGATAFAALGGAGVAVQAAGAIGSAGTAPLAGGVAGAAVETGAATGTAHAPATGAANHAGVSPAPRGLRSNRLLAAVAGVAILALLVGSGLFAARAGPFAPSGALPVALAASFGPGSLARQAGLPGSAGAGDPTMSPLEDGSVAETVLLAQPAAVDLGFGYCDAFVCGTSENLDCVGNKYMPRFGDALLGTFSLAPPAGSTLRDVVISGGPYLGAGAAHVYQADGKTWGATALLLAGSPSVGTAGALQLNFPVPWKHELDSHYSPTLKSGCGFTPDERKAFTARYGTRYTPPYPYLRLVAHWTRPARSSGSQALSVNGNSRAVSYTLASAITTPGVPRVYRQDDPRWSGQRAGSSDYAHAGTVPAAIASLLSAFGGSEDPAAVGRELVARGAWKPGRGGDWSAIAGYLRDKHVSATESNLSAATAAGKSAVFLAAYRNPDARRETLVTITGYDAAADHFMVIDPALGATQVSWDDLAAGSPWILAVTRVAAAT